MKPLLAIAAGVFSICAALPALAQTCARAPANMAGLYGLEGVREMGSQIMLRADGRFQYMLAYGAVDEAAEGCWRRVNDVVFLKPTRMLLSRGGNKFTELRLIVDRSGGLVRQFGGGMTGAYRKQAR